MRLCLDPRYPEAHAEHIDDCVAGVEATLAADAALEQSAGVACSICYEIVVESKKRFGILPACEHPFCLSCIREWRSQGSTQVRACPICRQESYYVVPSEFWVNDRDAKAELIEEYKGACVDPHAAPAL